MLTRDRALTLARRALFNLCKVLILYIFFSRDRLPGHTACYVRGVTRNTSTRMVLCTGLVLGLFAPISGSGAEENSETQRQLQVLQRQNQALQEQMRQQQHLIEALTRQVQQIQEATRQPRQASEHNGPEQKDSDAISGPANGSSFGRVHLSAEGGVAFFHSGSEGQFPNGEFRLDEARLFLEAPIYGDTYFFGEMDLATREEPDLTVKAGELYVDVENVSKLWHQEHVLNLRMGRMFIPFGEEYLNRYAIDNPLISHSVSDLWGVDEGLELYGGSGKLSYAAAVQNGGIPDTRDFNADKSVAGRIGFDPTTWLHLSASGMRTGDLAVQGDRLSAMWFGGGFFRSLGSAKTTTFHADLAEADLEIRLPRGRLRAFGGYIHYDDNDLARSNQRDVYYYALEGSHDLVGKLSGAVRFSQIFAPGGFPIVGNGDFGDYFAESLTTELWRLSLGLGYRWSEGLVVKLEYSLEGGRTTEGETRDHENLFGVEAAFKF